MKIRALIIDDEPDNRIIAEKVLSFNGAKVVTAENGVQGMAVLEKVTPSFILLDLSMPGVRETRTYTVMEEVKTTNALPI